MHCVDSRDLLASSRGTGVKFSIKCEHHYTSRGEGGRERRCVKLHCQWMERLLIGGRQRKREREKVAIGPGGEADQIISNESTRDREIKREGERSQEGLGERSF